MRGASNWAMVIGAGVVVSMGAAALGQIGPVPTDDSGVSSLEVHPEIVLTREEHNFGAIDDAMPVKTKVEFKNSGSATLIVKNVRATCGCTVPQLSKKEYAPGESGEVEVQFNPAHKRNHVEQIVTIESNDPKSAEKRFTIKADVTPLVSQTPEQVSFGDVAKGAGAKQTVVFTARVPGFKLAEPVTVSDPKSIAAAIVGSEEKTLPDGAKVVEAKVEITLLADAKVGPVGQNVTLRTNDVNRVLNIGVFANIIGELQTNPVRAFIGSLAPSAPIQTSFKVTSRSGKAFKIVKVEDAPYPGVERPALTVEAVADTPENTSYTIKITGTAPDKAIGINGDVVVTTDVPGEETVKVGYAGFVQLKPAAQAAPGAVPMPVGGPVVPPATTVTNPSAPK